MNRPTARFNHWDGSPSGSGGACWTSSGRSSALAATSAGASNRVKASTRNRKILETRRSIAPLSPPPLRRSIPFLHNEMTGDLLQVVDQRGASQACGYAEGPECPHVAYGLNLIKCLERTSSPGCSSAERRIVPG